MLNLRLLQETIRENKRLWLICTALLTAGMLVCEAVYGTDAGEKLWQFFSVIPGMTGEISQNDASLTGYLGSCMFGAWFLMIPAVYSAVAAVRMAAGKMEDGSFAGLVSILGNRHKICFTQDYWMGTSLLAMFVSTGILGILGGIVLAGYELEIAQYLLLNLGMFCFQLMLGGFFMMISFLLKKGRKAALAVGGFLIVEYLLYALSDLNGLSAAGYLSVFSAFRPEEILLGGAVLWWKLPLWLAAGLLFYKAGSVVAARMDIPS